MLKLNAFSSKCNGTEESLRRLSRHNHIFFSSVIFVWKYKSARIVLAALVVTLAFVILVFSITNSAHLIGIAHIAVWGPLAFYLIKSDLMHSSFQYSSPYGVWIILLLGTITVSIVFDVRDITLVLLGKK